ALVVDVFTAVLTYAESKKSMNIKAAFLHNVTDALASIGVIVTGALILWYDWIWTDAAMTLVISGYVLWQSIREMPKVIHLLMEGTPEGIEIEEVEKAIEEVEGVKSTHHLHIWQLDENRDALEAHVVLEGRERMDEVKFAIKELLLEKFQISHSTLEFEDNHCQIGRETDHDHPKMS
ncbi:MAG: cation transporter, partial [Bdellovibrionales bacterium]|nr:cation transporter [Bdellovibrionales bacterium]